MDNTVVVALIAIIPTLATGVSTTYLNSKRKKDKEEAKKIAQMNASKSAILDMITQDIIYVDILKRRPENHKSILDEYDKYTDNGGNSWLKEKVDVYLNWYDKTV